MSAIQGYELAPPPPVLEIADRLERGGFETWCVGGAVRDALLGHPHLDWDLATAATPAEVQRLFKRTKPIGIEFGTVGVLKGGHMFEVTTFRRDVRTDGRHAVVEFGASLDEDLARRDFTINAIAYSPSRRRVHDPFDGRGDLERGVIRAVGDPRERMREDRLRALRAIRFAGRFGFAIEPQTWAAILESAPHLGRLSPERVKQELEKTMEQVSRPARAIRRWKESGAFATLVPPLADLPETAIDALDHLPPPGLARRPHRAVARLAALFLHLDGRTADRTLRGLRFSNSDVAWIVALVDRWRRLGEEMTRTLVAGPADDGTLRRWAAAAGRTRLAPLLRLAAAMWDARRAAGEPAPPAERVRSTYRRALRVAWRDPIELGDLAVDGNDLADAGIPSGPLVGKILHALVEVVIGDPSANTRERLLAEAQRLYERYRTENGKGG
ncbi:MAG TPA: CCA tRNA nucleotidyltransferase [Gemmatimonadaceae bacterium]